jgi:Fe-Mn family superoxide dismutase
MSVPFSIDPLHLADWCDADDYGALEPSISGKIMELHHKMHHQTYVNSYNAASEQLAAAESKQDIQSIIALQPLINFHGGGHVNHSLFWENLAPSQKGGGGEPEGKLKVRFSTALHLNHNEHLAN